MRSWTPKALRISSSAFKLHHAPPKRTFRIIKYENHKHRPFRLVKEVKGFPPSQLPVVRDTTVEQEQQPQDLKRKIIFGADKDENIAAYEHRHQRFLKVLQGTRNSGGTEPIEEHGISRVERVERAPSIQDDGPQIRRRISFFAQTESLSASSRSSRNDRQSPGNPAKTKISNNISFDAEAPAGSKPFSFIRPDLWSQPSMRNVKAREESLGSESAIVEEVRTSRRNEYVGSFRRLSLGIADEEDAHSDDHKALYINMKKRDDGSEIPLAINKENSAEVRHPRLSTRAVQRSEFESVGVLDASGMTSKGKEPFKRVRKSKMSLFEELFPEEASKHSASEKDLKPQYPDIPKLSLPILDGDESFGNEYMRGRITDSDKAKAASQSAFQFWNPSILVLQVASPSLIDSDFRRIAPKGQHISEWTGPGDYFKGTPVSPPRTPKN